jgi:hypothetical protein
MIQLLTKDEAVVGLVVARSGDRAATKIGVLA